MLPETDGQEDSLFRTVDAHANRIVRNPAATRASETTSKAMALITPAGVSSLCVGSVTIHGDTVHDARGTDPTVYPRPFDDVTRYTVNPLGTAICTAEEYARVLRFVLVYVRVPTSGVRAPVAHPWEQSQRLFNVSSEAKTEAAATLTADLEAFMEADEHAEDLLMPREAIMRYLVSVTLASESEENKEKRRRGKKSRHLGCQTLFANSCTSNPRSFNGDEFVCRNCLSTFYCPLAAAAEALFLWASRTLKTLPHLRAYYGSKRCVSYVSIGTFISQFLDECLRIVFFKTFGNFQDWMCACLVQACCAAVHAPRLTEKLPAVVLTEEIPLPLAPPFAGVACPQSIPFTMPLLVPLPAHLALPGSLPIGVPSMPPPVGVGIAVQVSRGTKRPLPPVPVCAPVPPTQSAPPSVPPLPSKPAADSTPEAVPASSEPAPSAPVTKPAEHPSLTVSFSAALLGPVNPSAGFLPPSASHTKSFSMKAVAHPSGPPAALDKNPFSATADASTTFINKFGDAFEYVSGEINIDN